MKKASVLFDAVADRYKKTKDKAPTSIYEVRASKKALIVETKP